MVFELMVVFGVVVKLWVSSPTEFILYETFQLYSHTTIVLGIVVRE